MIFEKDGFNRMKSRNIIVKLQNEKEICKSKIQQIRKLNSILKEIVKLLSKTHEKSSLLNFGESQNDFQPIIMKFQQISSNVLDVMN